MECMLFQPNSTTKLRGRKLNFDYHEKNETFTFV